MASTHKHIRSSTANKRPTTAIADGQIALNTNSTSPGLFFKDSTGATIIKVGPVHVGTAAPNVSPASGGSSGNSTGEIWLDTSLTPNGVKIWNGSSWTNATPIGSTTVQGLLELATSAETQTGTDVDRAVTPAGLQSKVSDSTSTTSSTTIASSTAVKAAYDLANAALPKAGGTITGNLEIGTTGSLTFEGSTADGFETTLAVVNPTADRTITLPNVSGTVVTTGDTGSVTSAMIVDLTIVNGDVSASAAIAGTKISPDFGSQNVTTTGTATAAALIPSGSSVPTNGVYLPSANNVAISTNSSQRLLIDDSGNVNIDSNTLYIDATNDRVGLGDNAPGSTLTVKGATGATPLQISGPSSEFMRCDSNGRLLVGTSTSTTVTSFTNSNGTVAFTEQQKSSTNTGALYYRTSDSVSGPRIYLGKSRDTSIVQSGDSLGQVEFGGFDGTNTLPAALIRSEVDGTPGANDMPGRLVLSVTADGASSPTEALRITNDRVLAYNQPDVTSKSAAATLTITELKTGIIQYTGAAATLTLPTGTLSEGGFSGIYNNMTFEWSVINTGSGTCTIGAGTAHTIVGGATIAAGASGRFASRRTTGNTFVTYRLS